MASNEKDDDGTITLTEQDIPGAQLPKPPENCTIAILKRWLSCRGAKVSGKRNELIKRVNDYIRSGLDSKNLIDPDGGINVHNKRKKLGLQEDRESTLVDFPTKGFVVGINSKLDVGYPQIWKFLIDDVEFKKQLSVEKPIVKGYNFYKSGKVKGIYTKQEGELFYVKSQVKSSYDNQDDKHKNIYTVKIVMNAKSQVQEAVCPCPAGNDGRCNHLAATLFAMEDACKKAVSTTTGSEDDLPCTSKPCSWGIPKKRKQEPSTVQAVKFVKHVYGKNEKECSSSSRVYTSHDGNTDYNALLEKIKAVEKKTRKKIGLHFIIPQLVPEYSTTFSEETPKPSKWDIVSPVKTTPLSMLDIEQKSLRTKARLYDSIKDRNDITEATKEQHLTRTWYDVRKPRITASKCKRCLIRPTTSPTKAISEVLMYNDHAPTKAMKEGIDAESKIISEFEKDTGITVQKSGFVISESHPFLGASPDGIIDNHTIVEVKNITVKEGESHEDAMCRLGIYKKTGSRIEINKNHSYYHQVQQQLFCTQSNSCHFIVASAVSTNREVIPFDCGFWTDILPKLESFYFNHLFPELVYPRIFHGEMRWNKELEFPRLL